MKRDIVEKENIKKKKKGNARGLKEKTNLPVDVPEFFDE